MKIQLDNQTLKILVILSWSVFVVTLISGIEEQIFLFYMTFGMFNNIEVMDLVMSIFPTLLYVVIPLLILFSIHRYAKNQTSSYGNPCRQWFITGIVLILFEIIKVPLYPVKVWDFISAFNLLSKHPASTGGIVHAVAEIIFIVFSFCLGFYCLEKGKAEFEESTLDDDQRWYFGRQQMKVIVPLTYAVLIVTIFSNLEFLISDMGIEYLFSTQKDLVEVLQFAGLILLERFGPVALMYVIYHLSKGKIEEPLSKTNRWLAAGILLLLLNLRYIFMYIMLTIGIAFKPLVQPINDARNLGILNWWLTITFAGITFVSGYWYVKVGLRHMDKE